MDLNFEEQIFGGANPFPQDDARHELWVVAFRIAAEEDAALRARFLGDGLAPGSCLDFFSQWFDIRAKAVLHVVVWGYDSAKIYKELLGPLATAVSSWAQKECPARFGTAFHVDISTRITQRTAHWTHQALKAAREQTTSRMHLGPPEVAAAVPMQDESTMGRPSPADLSPAHWEDVSIEFTSDERVQITVVNTVTNKSYTQNYAEMGFTDGRTQKPTQAWIFLVALAKANGGISSPPAGKKWSGVEKRVQKTRRILRAHFLKQGFDIPRESDPLPFSEGAGNGYRTVFKVALNRSFHS